MPDLRSGAARGHRRRARPVQATPCRAGAASASGRHPRRAALRCLPGASVQRATAAAEAARLEHHLDGRLVGGLVGHAVPTASPLDRNVRGAVRPQRVDAAARVGGRRAALPAERSRATRRSRTRRRSLAGRFRAPSPGSLPTARKSTPRNLASSQIEATRFSRHGRAASPRSRRASPPFVQKATSSLAYFAPEADGTRRRRRVCSGRKRISASPASKLATTAMSPHSYARVRSSRRGFVRHRAAALRPGTGFAAGPDRERDAGHGAQPASRHFDGSSGCRTSLPAMAGRDRIRCVRRTRRR